jgi:hypothetical protein
LILDRFHRGKPHRVNGADEPHHRHQERCSIEVVRAFGLHKGLQFIAPEIREDIMPNLVPRPLPDPSNKTLKPDIFESERAGT